MFFGDVPVGEAVGARLAHSLVGVDGRVRKGTLLDDARVAALAAAGHERIVVARLDADDEHEDAAAARVADALRGANLRVARATTGRANLFADADGLLVLERDALIGANRVTEAITVATLAENLRVGRGRLVASVKIIPFGVARRDVERVLARLAAVPAPLALAPVRARDVALVHTTLPALRDAVIEKTSRVTRERLAARAMRVVYEGRCAHAEGALADALRTALRARPELVLIVGASAIADRRDVVPAAVERAGGRVERFGLPIDPGNLLLVARLGPSGVLGLPGCARSPRDNGLDRVLDRIACDVPLAAAWLESLAVGGLLEEIVERPAPRIAPVPLEDGAAQDGAAQDGAAQDGVEQDGSEKDGRRHEGERAASRIGALVLAAGASRRAGTVNKLLYPVAGEPMLRRVVRRVAASGVDDIVVVTGHDADAVERALGGLDVRLCHNGAHASGMGGSLARGLAVLVHHEAVLICLGDMPGVSSAVLDRLIEAWREERRAAAPRPIVVPVTGGRRGNPVLVGQVFFDLLLALAGDVGARELIRTHPDAVRELDVDDEGVLLDHDTLAELRTLDRLTDGT